MNDTNTVILSGRLTRDPEVRFTPSGQQVTNFGIAVSGYAGQDEAGQRRERTDFINCTAWGKTGEALAERQQKGAWVLVEGRLQVRSWEDRDGQKRTAVEVVANRIQFLDWTHARESAAAGGQTAAGARQEAADDIPF